MTDSYERLEYLGDAVLDYLISTIIITSEPLGTLDPGKITDIRYEYNTHLGNFTTDS